MDLDATRAEVRRHLGVLRSDVLAMEIFGSDEQTPKAVSLDWVRQSNLFIGVYAHRYGSIDPDTGLSITELEYHEAKQMLDRGELLDLLVYVIDREAAWPTHLIDFDSDKHEKLEAFKSSVLRRHTATIFRDAAELPLLILRDVLRVLGVSGRPIVTPRKVAATPARNSLARPVGMEFYTPDLSPFFWGRADETNDALGRALTERMSVMVGASGVGKTSLIHAAVVPALQKLGWAVALTRPLDRPINSLRSAIWSQLLEGSAPDPFPLRSVVRAAAAAHSGRQVLVIVDQFEDVLASAARSDVPALLGELRELHHAPELNVHFLFSYRADAEAELGEFWQRISGAAVGLPRQYVVPLSANSAADVLTRTLEALGVGDRDDQTALASLVIEDLEAESRMSGMGAVYPPYLQMVLMWLADARSVKDIRAAYDKAGRARGVIAAFLMSQLRYLGEREADARSVLIALASAYGRKTQKMPEEIAREADLEPARTRAILRALEDLRFVRSVDQRFEIVHDFLAGRIIELASTEEKEVKRFRDLLAIRSQSYGATRAVLTRVEHDYIYRHRKSYLTTQDEVAFLLASHLAGTGPVRYWLRGYDRSQVAAWVRQLTSAGNLEGRVALTTAARLRFELGERLSLPAAVERLNHYEGRRTLVDLVPVLAGPDDADLLVRLARSRSGQLASAAADAFCALFSATDLELVDRIGRSTSPGTLDLLRRLAEKDHREFGLETAWELARHRRKGRALLGLHLVRMLGGPGDLEELQALLAQPRLATVRREAVRGAIIAIASRAGRHDEVKALLYRTERNPFHRAHSEEPATRTVLDYAAVDFLESPGPGYMAADFLDMVRSSPFWSDSEGFAAMAARFARSEDAPRIKVAITDGRLDDDTRAELLLALAQLQPRSAFSFTLDLLLESDGNFEFTNASELLTAIGARASRRHLPRLHKVIGLEGFWRTGGKASLDAGQLPVRNAMNAHLVRRLVGLAFAHVADGDDIPTLLRLCQHPYWTVWSAAAAAIGVLGDEQALDDALGADIASGGIHDGLAAALQALDERLYPLPA